VHLIRHSLEFVSWKDRKLVVPALKAIYRAKNTEAGLKALAEFEASFWGQRYPAIAQSWQRNWEHVVPFFAYPDSVAPFALEGTSRMTMRRWSCYTWFLNNAADEWKRPLREWFEAKTQFAIVFGERFVSQWRKTASRTKFLILPVRVAPWCSSVLDRASWRLSVVSQAPVTTPRLLSRMLAPSATATKTTILLGFLRY
jgi:hypothetical protein